MTDAEGKAGVECVCGEHPDCGPLPRLGLSTVSPHAPLGDLAPFLELAASCSVIGLGEATHGTSESFQLKHRLIRALANARDLRTVAFECGLAAGRLIDEYVRFGRGAAHDALARQGYWCWENREVLELVEWLRDHNAALAPDERIAFVGVDVQGVETALPELAAAFDAAAQPVAQVRGAGSGSRVQEQANKFISQLTAGELERGDPAAAAAVRTLTEAAPFLPLPELRALCRNVARYVDVYLNPEHENGLGLRDEYLAATVLETLAERPGRLVVWAHNEHVAVNPDFFGTRAMGHHLREALGERYLPLGMLFGEGAFLARSWQGRSVSEFRVGEAAEGHTERCFAGRDLGLYGTASYPAGNGARFRRFLGALYDHQVDAERPDAFRIERPLTDFDLVAWFPETSAARYLGGSSAEAARSAG